MTGGTARFQIVFFIQNRAELADLKRLGRGANVDGGVSSTRWRERARDGHDTPNMQKSGCLFSSIFIYSA